ncbi:MAG: ABC transporter substrate-binding protein [Chloroflexi bacterium]|nr:ABC transporter substrate-binding protein [Chloroflexota bacterium]
MKQTTPKTMLAGLVVLLVICILLAGCSPAPTAQPTSAPTVIPIQPPVEVVLTMGSWRTDDVEQMNHILDRFHERYPNITVEFDPTPPSQYDAVLKAQLENGTAPDLFYLRSYAASRNLFDQGYLEPLDDLPGLHASFSPDMLSPWATDDGRPYGVPFIATSHGIYYNIDLFDELNLEIPATWEELLSTAQTIQDAGFIPFANTSGSQWTMAEIVFMNLAPNFIGGREGRMEYLTGERCFDDAHVVAAFQAIADIAPFLPENQDLLSYADSLQFFLQGKAVMWMGGSWDIPYFESENPDFTWSVFAPPPPSGDPGYITFHLDAGMGLNDTSSHKEEAKKFLEWLTTSESAELLGNELPGFFPMHTQAPLLENEHANAFLSLNQGRGTDVRFAWEKLREGSPDGYTLMLDGAVAVVNGEQTPQQAADALQAGLAQWFGPARECRK